MKHLAKVLSRLAAVGLLLAAAGCSNANLGAIDDSPDSREVMPGPGIFDDSDGESPFTWNSDAKDSTAPTAKSESAAAAGAASTSTQEKAEFEEFKLWNRLRTEGVESAEYQEFLQWLEYRKFKSAN